MWYYLHSLYTHYDFPKFTFHHTKDFSKNTFFITLFIHKVLIIRIIIVSLHNDSKLKIIEI
nr:MAG TPA: hypothetical protein [Caudoviricetes sp.]